MKGQRRDTRMSIVAAEDIKAYLMATALCPALRPRVSTPSALHGPSEESSISRE